MKPTASSTGFEAGQAPLLSIGLPVRNGEPHLTTMIDSILAQTFTDFELIISDNHSTDRTPGLCAAYAARDRRVRYCPVEENIGAIPNHNRTIELARGRFFKVAGHDDMLAPTFLARCMEALEQAPDAVVAYPRTMFIDANGEQLGMDTISLATAPSESVRHRLETFFPRISYINPLFGVIRIDALRRTRRYQAFLKSDQVLIAELLMLGRFVEVPDILFFRRLHPASSLRANPTKAALRRFYDPRRRSGRATLPLKLRLTLGYLHAAATVPPRWSERPGCVATTLMHHTLPALRDLTSAAIFGPKATRVRLKTAR